MSVPSSIIHVMSGVPMNESYEHSLYFDSAEDQSRYFIDHKVGTYNEFSYLRQESAIKVDCAFETAKHWNYLMLANRPFPSPDQWEYYFISKVEYINDRTVKLHIEIDVIQSFMFKWKMHQCFIERTHTPTDQVGQHTIDEGLELGELRVQNETLIDLGKMCVLFLSASDVTGNKAYAKVYDGVFSGLAIFAVNIDNYQDFGLWLDTMEDQGEIEAITSMWMYPKDLVRIDGSWDVGTTKGVLGSSTSKFVTVSEKITNSFDGYTPKNKKLLTYPYTMIYVSNNMGGCAVYRRERFGDNTYKFKIVGALSPDSGVELVPQGYDGVVSNYDQALTMGSFPSCAWESDVYKVWLAQNQHQIDHAKTSAMIQAGAGLLTTIASAASGNMIGAVGGLGVSYNALNNIQGIMAQQKDMEAQPPQARGNHSANINIAQGKCGFTVQFKTITAERAVTIDNFFSRYGYRINRVDVPSLKNRERFTYIKTQGCHVTGPISSEYQERIQNVFNKGITFWAQVIDGDFFNVGNYTYDNNCL